MRREAAGGVGREPLRHRTLGALWLVVSVCCRGLIWTVVMGFCRVACYCFRDLLVLLFDCDLVVVSSLRVIILFFRVWFAVHLSAYSCFVFLL